MERKEIAIQVNHHHYFIFLQLDNEEEVEYDEELDEYDTIYMPI